VEMHVGVSDGRQRFSVMMQDGHGVTRGCSAARESDRGDLWPPAISIPSSVHWKKPLQLALACPEPFTSDVLGRDELTPLSICSLQLHLFPYL